MNLWITVDKNSLYFINTIFFISKNQSIILNNLLMINI